MPNFNYDVVNILDALDSSGKDTVKNIVSTFSYKNYEVEDFISSDYWVGCKKRNCSMQPLVRFSE